MARTVMYVDKAPTQLQLLDVGTSARWMINLHLAPTRAATRAMARTCAVTKHGCGQHAPSRVL